MPFDAVTWRRVGLDGTRINQLADLIEHRVNDEEFNQMDPRHCVIGQARRFGLIQTSHLMDWFLRTQESFSAVMIEDWNKMFGYHRRSRLETVAVLRTMAYLYTYGG